MLGTFQTNGIVNAGSFQIPFFPTSFVLAIPLGAAATADSSSGQKIYTILACLFFSMLFCMVINVSIERIGYKPLRNQPRLVPLITALGFSFILQDVGLVWKGAGPAAAPEHPPHRHDLPLARCHLRLGRLHRHRGHDSAPRRAHLSRAAYALGEGDAGDRARHGRLLDDGHQRRSHDLVHLRARRRARRRRRRDLRPLHRDDEVRPRLSPRPLRVHGGRPRRHRQPERGSARRESCSGSSRHTPKASGTRAGRRRSSSACSSRSSCSDPRASSESRCRRGNERRGRPTSAKGEPAASHHVWLARFLASLSERAQVASVGDPTRDHRARFLISMVGPRGPALVHLQRRARNRQRHALQHVGLRHARPRPERRRRLRRPSRPRVRRLLRPRRVHARLVRLGTVLHARHPLPGHERGRVFRASTCLSGSSSSSRGRCARSRAC